MHFGVQYWIWPCLLTLFVVFWQLVNYEDWILDPTGEGPGWTLFVFTPSRLGMGQFSMTVDDRPPLWLLIFVLPDDLPAGVKLWPGMGWHLGYLGNWSDKWISADPPILSPVASVALMDCQKPSKTTESIAAFFGKTAPGLPRIAGFWHILRTGCRPWLGSAACGWWAHPWKARRRYRVICERCPDVKLKLLL